MWRLKIANMCHHKPISSSTLVALSGRCTGTHVALARGNFHRFRFREKLCTLWPKIFRHTLITSISLLSGIYSHKIFFGRMSTPTKEEKNHFLRRNFKLLNRWKKIRPKKTKCKQHRQKERKNKQPSQPWESSLMFPPGYTAMVWKERRRGKSARL